LRRNGRPGKIGREHNYAIVDLATEAMIGVCGFFDTDHLNGTAELGIFIGDKAYWSRGYGREAMTLLLRYGFDYLNFENVLLRVYSFNARAIESTKEWASARWPPPAGPEHGTAVFRRDLHGHHSGGSLRRRIEAETETFLPKRAPQEFLSVQTKGGQRSCRNFWDGYWHWALR
jgi:hypothetical protein